MGDWEKLRGFEWPTLFLLCVTYAVWACATTVLYSWSAVLGIFVTALAIVQFSSLQHEMIHGHPFRNIRLNEALVFPALALFIPYRRFRDTHLSHHQDSILTDPYDDPESNYLDPGRWERLPPLLQAVLTFNNCLLGRLLVGPLISLIAFLHDDAKLIWRSDRAVIWGWILHVPALVPVLIWIFHADIPITSYLVATYIALSVLKIRTFLEHQAHEKARGRTVIIEDRGPLSFLFLNNNFHVVHHMHPKVPWYRLPVLYRENSERYLRRNEGYRYESYAEIFRRYFWRTKDPVPHPIWRRFR